MSTACTRRSGRCCSTGSGAAAIDAAILDAESIYDIDSTGAQVLDELLDALDERDVSFAMARVRSEIRDELVASGIEARVGSAHIYLEVDDAVRAHVARGRPPVAPFDQESKERDDARDHSPPS